jgi:dienelactone hydrolase
MVMPLFVLMPKNAPGPWPAVMCPHGHGESGGKWATTGCRHLPGLAETIDKHNYDYGVQFARAGLIAFCPDARGFGERLETVHYDNPLTKSCQWINDMAFPLGQTITGMWAWDLHRLIDYIATRDDCLPGRVGCAGLSGGGLQTLWASALDERIRCAIISGYFYGYREALLDIPCCPCNYVPHLYETADMGDIGALIAPRPLMIETGTRDSLNGASGLKNVRSQVRITRRAYRVLGAGGRLKHHVFEGEHRWDGVTAIPFMLRQLRALC